jgi:IS30 family transposase
MRNEEIQKIYSQLQGLKSIDLTRKKKLNPIREQLRQIILETLPPPEKAAQKICQKIIDDQLDITQGFVVSIYRMLKTEQLNKEGLEQIIATIKSNYQLN